MPTAMTGAGDRESSDNGYYRPSGGAGAGSGSGSQSISGKIIGLIIALILALLGFGSFLWGPIEAVVGISERLTIGNDSAGPAMERRQAKVMKYMVPDKEGVCKGAKVKCKLGKISNRSLKRMAKKGIIPYDGDKPVELKRTGYPDKNPTHYEFELEDGTKKKVSAADFNDFLLKRENRALAAKVWGRGGAFNMRFRAWHGKHISKAFYKKFGIARKGGIADGDRKTKLQEKLGKFKEKIRAKTSSDSVGNAKKKVEGAVSKHTSKAKKGGVAYMIAVAGCLGVKIPGLVASGVAMVQLAQIIPYVSDIVLSPGSKAMAAGFDNSFTAEDAETVGTALTERTPRESDKKLSSALDSPYLLSALGVIKHKLPVSNYTPGYSFLTSGVVKAAEEAKDASAPACNVIMSPAAMYSAAAVDAAVTVAASATIIGGLVKVAASWAVSTIIESLAQKVVGEVASAAFEEFATRDDIPKARGEQLGDVLGVSAAAFFSSGSMARHLPVLTKSGVQAFNQMKQENEQLHKEMEIASLSPLDTSSRYTFLGSINHTIKQSMLANGTYNASVLSMASNLMRLPAMALSFSSTAQAATNFSDKYCGYAGDFGLDSETENGQDKTPAINMAGLPCTGLTTNQDKMSTEEAIDLMTKEGWLDESVEISDGDDIEQLVSKGYIKKETPLADFITECGDASTGDYIFNAAGCVMDSSSSNRKANDISVAESCRAADETNKGYCSNGTPAESETVTASEGLKDPRSMAAISVFLVDYQVAQSINGEDDEEDADKESSNQQESQGSNIDNITMYYQNEEPWAKQNYGFDTIERCGCGPTTVASIVSTFYPDKQVNPKEMADYFVSLGGQLGNCGSKWIWYDRADAFKEKYKISVEDVPISSESAKKGLQEGGLVIISVGPSTPFIRGGGHIMFIRGVASNGNLLVGDPNSREKTTKADGFADSEFHFGSQTGTKRMWVIKKAS